MKSSEPAVKVEHLTKVFRTQLARQKVLAVSDLSFEVGVGEVYGLIGPNGSGKSTTMKVILGLIQATSGATEVFGIDSGKVGSRRDVGFLPENPYFYKHLTGAETLKFYGKLCGLRGAELKERVPELLELVGLEDAAKRRVGGYSKGMLQRIGLAQALVHEPRLVVLDEPTAGVDPRGSRQIRDLVLELKSLGKSVILCSHLLEQVQEVCDRVGIMNKGRMVREGTLDELTTSEEKDELVIEGMDEKLREKLEQLLKDGGAKIVASGRPRTTLEQLFLELTEEEKHS
ncbi:MAG: ABC-2 type transport system ATP-binding protein [Verrucomicrobiales bacterium]|jgi:ABC-2 type transport system ATP-binding protein